MNGCINECASINKWINVFVFYRPHFSLFIILSHSLTCSQLLNNVLLFIMWPSLITWIEHKLSVLCLYHIAYIVGEVIVCCNFTCEITPMSTGGQQRAGHVVSFQLYCVPVKWHVDDLVVFYTKKVRILIEK